MLFRSDALEDLAETAAYIITYPEKFVELVRKDPTGNLIKKFQVIEQIQLISSKNLLRQ